MEAAPFPQLSQLLPNPLRCDVGGAVSGVVRQDVLRRRFQNRLFLGADFVPQTVPDPKEAEAHHPQPQQQADGANGSPQVFKARQHQAETKKYGIRAQNQCRQVKTLSIPCLLHGPPLSVSNSFRC